MEEIVKCKHYVNIHIMIEPSDDADMVISQGADSIIFHTSEARQIADGIYRMLGDRVIVIPDNYGYDDFANDVANVLKDEYGEHLYNDFMNSLTAKLEKNG